MDSSRDLEFQCKLGEEYRCELEDNLEILRQVALFSAMPLDRLMLFSYLCRRVCFREGEFIFRQRDPIENCYIITSGTVHVFREFDDHMVKLHELEPYEIMGGLAFLSDIKHMFSVKAATHVECLVWNRESLRKIIEQFPQMTINIVDVLFKRLFRMMETLMDKHAHECVYTGQ
jgi:CRP-like cAMP-binding protein